MVIRCIIVDDEPPARDEWEYILSRMEGVEVVATAPSASLALEAIYRHEPDLVFLDIEMPGGNGFTVVEQLMDMEDPPLVIFATAFDQYAIRAFEENAIDYILKPLEEARVRKGLDKVRQRLSGTRKEGARQQPDTARQHSDAAKGDSPASPPDPETTEGTASSQGSLEHLLTLMGQRASFTRISVESMGRVLLLQPQDVFFCRADDKKVWAHTRTDRFLCHGQVNMGRLEERLEPHAFFRANRSDLVNMERVREFAPWFNGKYTMIMNDAVGTEIVVSRSRVKAFKERLGL
ncbi:LytR/AlgR family response regulator transcription factor [Desulfovibrio psychrotolerans]|uniref:DNA-binding response regulator n=1 Tax=Desulfovibrio psychrotolerans TaxID=415242 RepID=A0A7J0BT86_9BACT|nr:LytTR family DNA-binding domain-containing protein [Desulfovibrio psychrotolerans]GFM36391.1 DNA-binding response regulator [Desulfovibrio psychrotolerans]